jgi:biotin carboxyl carrier protein
MNLEDIETIADILRESSQLTEIELRSGSTSIRVRRPTPPKTKSHPPTTAPVEPRETVAAQKVSLVRSGGVGVFRFGANRAVPEIGEHVPAQTVLGHIETLRILSDVVISEAGTIVEIHISEGTPVEYGTVLFTLEKEKHHP